MQKQAPVDYIQRTKEQYDDLGYPSYHWVYNPDPPPFKPLEKPLAECKLALVASGGVYVSGQIAFHFKDDCSYRQIDTETPTSALRATHFAYDLTDARADPNVVFPLDTLKKCVKDGLLGELSNPAYTFMGGIYSARKVRDILAPALADALEKDEVDVALMVPV